MAEKTVEEILANEEEELVDSMRKGGYTDKEIEIARRQFKLESALLKRGYYYRKIEDGFVFYEKKSKESDNLKHVMGFKMAEDNAIIVYFGVLPTYPIITCGEVELLREVIKQGYEEEKELARL